MYRNESPFLNQNKDYLFVSISSLAKILNIHQRMLRIYDEKGILRPKRTLGNRRAYSTDDIQKAQLIQFLLKNLGLNLAGVKLVFLLLDRFKLDFEAQAKLVQEIAGLNYGSEVQKENIKKNLKKGRRKRV